ncbi:MAG: DUF2383 domain-containing protein [Chiayiivirga sp.]|jgi:hypothetical protein|nr:DUF2383 domain-containing protein [Chiayiivirga sp.]
MSDSTNILPDLIEATREGGEFYAEAAVSVKDSELSKLFKRMAQAKSDLAQELSNEIAPKVTKPAARTAKAKAPAKTAAKVKAGKATKDGWVGEIHAVYRGLSGGLKTIKQDQVSLIEETENQLLGRVQQVRHDKANSYVVRVLAMQYENPRPRHGRGVARPQAPPDGKLILILGAVAAPTTGKSERRPGSHLRPSFLAACAGSVNTVARSDDRLAAAQTALPRACLSGHSVGDSHSVRVSRIKRPLCLQGSR